MENLKFEVITTYTNEIYKIMAKIHNFNFIYANKFYKKEKIIIR